MATHNMNRVSSQDGSQPPRMSNEEAEFWGIRKKPSSQAQKQRQSLGLNATALTHHYEIKTEKSVDVNSHAKIDRSVQELPPQAAHAPSEQPTYPPKVVCKSKTQVEPNVEQQQQVPPERNNNDNDLPRHLNDIQSRQVAMYNEMIQLRAQQEELNASQIETITQLRAQNVLTEQKLELLLDQNKEIIARVANISREQDKSREPGTRLAHEMSAINLAVERLPNLGHISTRTP
ncbi:hypothetical protein DOTSEDRAFT_79740 [Dothistroma septosporum NZE10]|uniref:Uncharacterized protein n=1 Tax=Dothistroma septosporum (strain NZE10 / CBS 128990) TaxID=675120 RepID=N1PL39_DOTSN|nr:hypothetical protein DOTSEDRAFT_79740 [Dothistroma septosporum NZE10]